MTSSGNIAWAPVSVALMLVIPPASGALTIRVATNAVINTRVSPGAEPTG